MNIKHGASYVLQPIIDLRQDVSSSVCALTNKIPYILFRIIDLIEFTLNMHILTVELLSHTVSLLLIITA